MKERLKFGEKLRYFAVPALVVLGLGVTACGSHVDGLAGLDLLNCKNGPKQNTLELVKIQKVSSFTLAQSVYVRQSGSFTDGVTVTGQGDGEYTVRLATGTLELDGGSRITAGVADDPIVTTMKMGQSFTYSEEGESYEVTARSNHQEEGHDEPELVIKAACDS